MPCASHADYTRLTGEELENEESAYGYGGRMKKPKKPKKKEADCSCEDNVAELKSFIEVHSEIKANDNEDGTFEIKVNDSDLVCIKARPIVANIPVGAEDSTLGTVTKAYQMLLPSVNDAGSNELVISPFTSLIGEAILKGKNDADLTEDLSVYEGCQSEGDAVASKISAQVSSLISNIESNYENEN